ncbi:MAG: efflux RND transporter periplasmic adaptor subunit [Rhodobacteraceae bacterium]|nr:efflux RND transporter periplasmic adaptor subunit [Paracoccaceae bacterium]
MFKAILAFLTLLVALPAWAGVLVLEPTEITEWKAVYGEVETRDRVPARARIGGTVVQLLVTEGDSVQAGQQIALVEDDKLNFQLRAIDAQLGALQTQLETAQTDLDRGESLRERGIITQQRLDQLRTQVDVLQGQIDSTRAERRVIEQQVTEGGVLSPDNGVVLSVPIALGSVITPGETVAEIGGGGVFLRLSIPERHATALATGGEISFGEGAGLDGQTGRLAKVYPQIEGGRVLADVEVEGLDGRFIGRRVPVRLPVATRAALLVPVAAVSRAGGLDFVTVEGPQGPVRRAVVPGQSVRHAGADWVEILSGLAAGDRVVSGDE